MVDSQRPTPRRDPPAWGERVPDEERYIRCRNADCQQVLGERSESGRRITVFSPYIVLDERGRVEIDCPICRRRVRLPRAA